MQKKVVILGGGVAGLSAAHELIERGFSVEVYETKKIPGGKARSIPVPDTGSMGPNGPRKPLPGEHGFRFFPRFYKHVVDTMSRIPYGKDRTVEDNLVDTTRVEMARYGQRPIEFPSRSPRTFADVWEIINELPTILGPDFGVSPEEMAYFSSRVWQIITSCEERRMVEYEKQDWWEFVGAEERSPAYQKIFGHGITRSLVAAKARLASTKTIGDIFVQLLFDLVEPGPSSDRLLNAPTNEAWIYPWLAYLTQQGVRYHLEAKVQSIECVNGVIQGATIEKDGQTFTAKGDYYIGAVPIERMAELVTDSMIAADPGFGKLKHLSEGGVSWMNGIQLYLTHDVPLTHGHTIYLDSAWALTSVSQRQFWPGIDFSEYGDGHIQGIISVDISEWDEKGINGKTAKECTREEVKSEVWAQLKKSINIQGKEILKDEYLDHWFLDPAIYLVDGEDDTNEEPLLVNLINTWSKRPDAVTKIPNLFLASDYVRTYTDLATMEGANEAARRAVNGIIDASQTDHPKCEIWKLHEQELFEPWRMIDRIRFQQGLPWDDSLINWGLSALSLAHQGGKILESLMTVGVDQPLDQFGNPIYNFASQGFDNIELRKELMDILQRTVLSQLVQMAESQHIPEMRQIPYLPSLPSPKNTNSVSLKRESSIPSPHSISDKTTKTNQPSQRSGRLWIIPE